jgi:hypothetical protein
MLNQITQFIYWKLRSILLVVAALTLLLSGACGIFTQKDSSGLAKLEPVSGTYFGVSLDWEHDSAIVFNQRLGKQAAVYVGFFSFPFDSTQSGYLDYFMQQVLEQKGLALITLEPFGGLQTITEAVAQDLGVRLAQYNKQGIPVLVRFAHEMNGSWYPWSQQPSNYIKAFNSIASAVHEHAPDTAMLWAPNSGGGYPFAGGKYIAKPGSDNFTLLDTNKDGKLSMDDDMYLPYYPGDSAVDWVGMSVYHWGNSYPWGENEIPEEGKYVAIITGNYNGLDGDQWAVPDFYDIYANLHKKPVAITETAALFNPSAGGAAELLIKQTWWRQVFNPQNIDRFPKIKMINWFEWRKYENETKSEIDWTVTYNADMAKDFLHDLMLYHPVFADALDTKPFR